MLSTDASAMQSDPWAGIEPEHKAPETSIDGTVTSSLGNFDGQIIMLQPSSNASKIIGICCIIVGAFNVLSIIAYLFLPQIDPSTGDEITTSTLSSILTLLSGIVSIVTLCLGGYMMVDFQRRGIFLIIGGIAFGFILSTISVLSGDFDEIGDSLGVSNGAANSVLVGAQGLCNAICALIVAIPLMVANNGLDDSKLF